MSDIDKFALALHHYIDGNANWSTEERHEKYLVFQRDIENLQCNDFRWFYYRAHFLSSQEQLEDAKIHIDRAIELISNLSNVDKLSFVDVIILSFPTQLAPGALPGNGLFKSIILY